VECSGDFKCCVDSCGAKKCGEIETTTTDPDSKEEESLKDGECPEYQNDTSGKKAKIKCGLDKECRGKKKCCSVANGGRECLSPVKKGRCPNVASNPICDDVAPKEKANLCGTDWGCSDGQKCCPNECTGKRCRDPVLTADTRK
jgi:hypothetical protein